MANRFNYPRETALDSNGDPLAGAKLYFYESGTTNAADTYSDEGLTVANTNPVVADSAGRFGDIFLQSADYKVVLADASGATIWTADPVHGTIDATGDEFKASPQSPADMTVQLSAGAIFGVVAKTYTSVAVQNSALMIAPVTNPRRDIVYIDRLTGTAGIETGTEAASPSDPTIADGKLPVARIALATTTTEIDDSLITDIRELGLLGAGSTATKNTGTSGSTVPLLDGVNAYSAGQSGAVVALVDGANIALDLSLSNNFSVTLAGNRTLDNPTNDTAGQSGVITVTQDGTGSRTLSFGTQYEFAGGTAPTLTTTASATDVLYYYVEAADKIHISFALDFS